MYGIRSTYVGKEVLWRPPAEQAPSAGVSSRGAVGTQPGTRRRPSAAAQRVTTSHNRKSVTRCTPSNAACLGFQRRAGFGVELAN